MRKLSNEPLEIPGIVDSLPHSLITRQLKFFNHYNTPETVPYDRFLHIQFHMGTSDEQVEEVNEPSKTDGKEARDQRINSVNPSRGKKLWTRWKTKFNQCSLTHKKM